MNVGVRSRLDSYLRTLSKRRKASTITADDAHMFFDRKTAGFDSLSRLAYINSILTPANDRVVPVGTTKSRRPAAKGRTIKEWTYVS